MSGRPPGLLLALLPALLLGAGAAGGQEVDGYRFLPEERWGRLPASAVGDELYVEGRWNECFGDRVSLYRADASQGFLVVEPRTPIHDQLVRDRAGDGSRLEKGVSNVRIKGVAEREGGRVVLRVKDVEVLQDDVERLQEAAAAAEEDPAAFPALIRDAERLAERYGDERLAALAEELTRAELRARRANLAPDDHPAAIELADRMLTIDDREGAITVLAGVEARAGGRLRQAALQRLQRLGAVRSRGSWVTREEFKRRDGFVQRGGRWVHREVVELREARREEIDRQREQVALPRTNPVEHGRDAKEGKVARGQNMAEVRLAGGTPVRVRHLEASGPQGAGARWTQWLLEDGRRVYFLEGEVIKVHPAGSPYPGAE